MPRDKHPILQLARAQGINTNFIKVLGLSLSNGLVGLSGGRLASYQGNVGINMGHDGIVYYAVLLGLSAARG